MDVNVIRIVNLPDSCTKTSIEHLVTVSCVIRGKIQKIYINKDTNLNLMFAYVIFQFMDDALRAKTLLNGRMHSDFNIQVDLIDPNIKYKKYLINDFTMLTKFSIQNVSGENRRKLPPRFLRSATSNSSLSTLFVQPTIKSNLLSLQNNTSRVKPAQLEIRSQIWENSTIKESYSNTNCQINPQNIHHISASSSRNLDKPLPANAPIRPKPVEFSNNNVGKSLERLPQHTSESSTSILEAKPKMEEILTAKKTATDWNSLRKSQVNSQNHTCISLNRVSLPRQHVSRQEVGGVSTIKETYSLNDAIKRQASLQNHTSCTSSLKSNLGGVSSTSQSVGRQGMVGVSTINKSVSLNDHKKSQGILQNQNSSSSKNNFGGILSAAQPVASPRTVEISTAKDTLSYYNREKSQIILQQHNLIAPRNTSVEASNAVPVARPRTLSASVPNYGYVNQSANAFRQTTSKPRLNDKIKSKDKCLIM